MTMMFLATWLPRAASGNAGVVDGPFQNLYVITAFSVVLVTGLALVFIRTFGRQDEDQRGDEGSGFSRPLFGLWMLAALAMAVFSIASGLPGYVDSTVPPYGAVPVGVTARTGAFTFEYPGGNSVDTLHAAVGQPVVLTMESTDVVHGLSIPAMRLHQAIVPGRTSRAWFTPTLADTFALQDDIFSGDSLLVARTALVVQNQADYDAWMQSVADIFAGRTLPEVGELLYNRMGCKACHTINGAKLVGPSFLNVYGHQAKLRDGSTVLVDAEYIKESILYPNNKVVEGYEPVMTPFLGKLDDKEIGAIVEWLKTLSEHGGAAETGAAAADSTAGGKE